MFGWLHGRISGRWLTHPKVIIFGSVLLALLLLIACGTAAPQAEKPMAKETPKEAAAPAAPKAPAAQPAAPVAPAAPAAKAPEAKAPAAAAPARAAVPDWVSIGQKKHYKGVIPMVMDAQPGFWDVHYGASATTVLTPSGPQFNQLLEYNPTNPTEFIGDLAESWETKDGGNTYTFRLHEATWWDGKPVTAQDVVFSLDRMVEPGALVGRVVPLRRFYKHKTAQAIDSRTVKVPLIFPASTFLPWMAVDYFKIYPKHVVETKTQDQLNCCPENNIGSGPWMIKEWKRGDSYEYERNPNYFKKGRPFFDGRKVFVIEDYARLLAALKTQQVMATAYMPSSFQPKDMLQVQEETKGRMKAYQAPNTSLYGFWMHLNKPPLDNPAVRRAIYLAIDRPEILKIALSGYGQVAGFFPPGYVETDDVLRQLPGYREPKDQDLAEAKKLLADAGYGSGMKLTYNIDQSKISRTHAEVAAAQLKKLGIEVTLQPADRAAFYVRLRDGTHNLSTIGSGFFFNEPETILDQWYALDTQRNPHDWKHPRLTELMNLQDKEVNPAARRAMFQEMAKILQQGEGHYVPVFWANAGGSLDYRLQNFQVPFHPHTVWKWDHVWFDPDAPLPK